MKNSTDGLNSWLDIVEGKIDQLEGKFEKDAATKIWEKFRDTEVEWCLNMPRENSKGERRENGGEAICEAWRKKMIF